MTGGQSSDSLYRPFGQPLIHRGAGIPQPELDLAVGDIYAYCFGSDYVEGRIWMPEPSTDDGIVGGGLLDFIS
jgi:hypothetical protein